MGREGTPIVPARYSRPVLLFYLALAVIVLIAVLYNTADLCPACGLRLVESPLDRLGAKDRLDHCRHCGWKRR